MMAMDAHDSLVEQIIEGYQAAMQRGASPREVASVRENLEFIVKVFEQPDTALGMALRRIREAVEPIPQRPNSGGHRQEAPQQAEH